MLVWLDVGGVWQEWCVADSGVFIQCSGAGAGVENKRGVYSFRERRLNLTVASEVKLYQDLRMVAERTKGNKGVSGVYIEECDRSVERVKGK